MSIKSILVGAGVALIALSMTAQSAPLKLQPANPQPSRLKPGLAVQYAYPKSSVRSLSDAEDALNDGTEPGATLAGLDNANTSEGQITLTSTRAYKVVAQITGFVRFDAPGLYDVDFLTNDGLRMDIGGQEVGKFDGVQGCDSTYRVTVEVPVAGWYPLEGLYYQNKGTACLHMRAGPKGKRPTWMPNEAFAH